MIPEIIGTWVSGVQSVLQLLWTDYVVYADSRPLSQKAHTWSCISAFRELTTMMIDLFPLTLPHRELYTRGKHPQQSDFLLPVGRDTNTSWPFTNSLAASSCSDFTVGYPNRLNATVVAASISSLLHFKLDINY